MLCFVEIYVYGFVLIINIKNIKLIIEICFIDNAKETYAIYSNDITWIYIPTKFASALELGIVSNREQAAVLN